MQYDVEWYQRVEHALGKKLDEYPIDSKETVLVLQERVTEAARFAFMQLKEEGEKKRRRGKRSADDGDGSSRKVRR